MVRWFEYVNMFGGSEFFPPGHVPGDISWYSFLGHFVTQDNSRGSNCPRISPGIGWYFCNYDDTDLISLYAKGCVRYGIFPYIHLSTSWEIVPACPGRDWFCAEPFFLNKTHGKRILRFLNKITACLPFWLVFVMGCPFWCPSVTLLLGSSFIGLHVTHFSWSLLCYMRTSHIF